MAEKFETLPPRLYRFRSYGATYSQGADKQSVFDFLAGRIRFARLRDFNDPFEGRPRAVPAFADAGEQRKAVHAYIYQLGRENGLSPGEARRNADKFVAGKTQSELVDWMGEKLIENSTGDGFYICCLSGSESLARPLTWSHYADHHRGVAIHCNTENPPFSFAFPVKYSQTYPEVIVPRTHQDPWEFVQRTYFTKSDLWSYEYEFRVMKIDLPVPGRDPRIASLMVQWEGATAITQREAIVGITIGARMPTDQKTELLARINAEFPHLEIWEAALHRTRYEITSVRVK